MNMNLSHIDSTTESVILFPAPDGCESRHSGGRIVGDTAGLRPSTRYALARLARLGVRPDRLWDQDFVRRMAWVAFETDREVTAWLKPDGTVAELQLESRCNFDSDAENACLAGTDAERPSSGRTAYVPVTDWCIRAGIGERKTVPQRERLMLLRGELRRVVMVGVGMGLPGTISLGWRSPAGTGGVILYTRS